jgi:hypothetical protein
MKLHAVKTYVGSGDIAACILDVRMKEMVSFTLLPLSPRT